MTPDSYNLRMHVRSDILQAFEDAINGVEIVAAVYTSNGTAAPPTGKVTVELGLIEEGPNRQIGGNQPNPAVVLRKLMVGARVAAAVPRDMSAKQFESTVLGPIETAIATCKALEPLADDWFIHTTQWQAAQDGAAQTIDAVMAWEVTYTTAAAQPGVAL
jgi:hypothetical protein